MKTASILRKVLWGIVASIGLIGTSVHASEDGIAWDKAPHKTNDLAALQNGAKLFVNYCLNCHSAAFMRYNRLTDIGLSLQQIKDNLLFTTDKVGETMIAAYDPKEAKQWFGTNPPDLSVIARSRSAMGKGSGADYLYTYLRTYYPDAGKDTGWNNLVFPNVGMPHALWQLQGMRTPLYDVKEEHGAKVKIFKGWEQTSPGTMTTAEYDSAVADLVNYLQWMAEPAQNTRTRVGVWVMLFLVLLTFVTWRLNAAFWKDIK